MLRHRMTRYLVVYATLALGPSLVQAQAFGINEIGTCAFSRGFSATSAPCNDASTIFWNPGATAGLKGNSVLVGAATINIAAKFVRDSALGSHEGDVPTQVVPHLFLNHNEGNWSAGIGVYVPYGLTSQWRPDFPGRFQAQKASIKTIYVQPNFAMSFQNGKYMIGGGPVWGHSEVELRQGIDLADQIAAVQATTTPPTIIRWNQLGIPRRTQFAHAELEGAANQIGLNVGFQAKLNDAWTFGLHYLSAQMMRYKQAQASFFQDSTGIVFAQGNTIGVPAGTQFDTLLSVKQRFCVSAGAPVPAPFGGTKTAICPSTGLLGTQKVQTQINHPDQLQFGFAYRGFKDWLVAVDYAWTGWRKFNELPIDFTQDSLDRVLIEDYNNTSSIRVGVERVLPNGWQVRAGFSGVASAAPDETVTPLLPEQDRTYTSIGTSIPILKDRVSADVAYGYVRGPGRRGRIDDRTARTQLAATINTGRYELHAHVVSLSLKGSF